MMLAIVMTTTMMSARVEATDSVAGVLTVGDLVISGNNATSLVGVQHVAGDLVITNASTLAGVEKLKIVEGNDNLSSLWGVHGLTRVENAMIEWNENLLSLKGLALSEVKGDFSAVRNENLMSLQGLESLTRVDGNLRIETG